MGGMAPTNWECARPGLTAFKRPTPFAIADERYQWPNDQETRGAG